MPEASMHEDHLFSRREYEIGRAWEITTMEAVSVSHAVCQLPNDHLGLRVLLADLAHLRADLVSAALSSLGLGDLHELLFSDEGSGE